MEEKIKKAFEIADVLTVISNQKILLKEEYLQKLWYYYDGSMFFISKEFISFIKLLIDCNQIFDVVLIDNNDIPVIIKDLKLFFDDVLSKYIESSNEYYTKYNQLIKTKKIESIIDLV